MEPDLLDIHAVCVFFGGTKPINRATVWRKIKEGIIPPPIPELQRWDRAACEAAKQALIVQHQPEAA